MKIPAWLWYLLLVVAGGVAVYLWVQRTKIATLVENRSRIAPAADLLEGGAQAASGAVTLWKGLFK
jgi:hypothetical protein